MPKYSLDDTLSQLTQNVCLFPDAFQVFIFYESEFSTDGSPKPQKKRNLGGKTRGGAESPFTESVFVDILFSQSLNFLIIHNTIY